MKIDIVTMVILAQYLGSSGLLLASYREWAALIMCAALVISLAMDLRKP